MGSGAKKPFSRLLECSVGVQVMVERTRGDVAKLAADIGYRACLVGHEGLRHQIAQRSNDAGFSARQSLHIMLYRKFALDSSGCIFIS